MNVIDRDSLKHVLEPVDTARGLGNAFYTNKTMFEEEKRVVFFDNWMAIGFGNDVPKPGYAKPIEFAGQPLLIVRNAAGTINVFENTCRHRGMILVDKPGKIKGAIRCPYHSWCYDHDGALKSTPYVGGPGSNEHKDIHRDELGLFKIRSHVWRDVIFVNISGTAPAFTEWAQDLIKRWSEFDQPIYHGGPESSFSLTVNTNWKLAVENYCESYHLPWIHPGLNSYSRLEDHYHIEKRGAYSGQGSNVYRQIEDEVSGLFIDFTGLDHKWDTAAEYISLYPNVLFGVHRDHVYAILLIPVDETTTIEQVEIYYASPDMLDNSHAALREKNARQWQDIFVEDVFVVEGMQRGRRGASFDGGKFSPAMDGPTHNFHHWVASQFVR